jgi:hypothetical protein
MLSKEENETRATLRTLVALRARGVSLDDLTDDAPLGGQGLGFDSITLVELLGATKAYGPQSRARRDLELPVQVSR